MNYKRNDPSHVMDHFIRNMDRVIKNTEADLNIGEMGRVTSINASIVMVTGLSNVHSEELVICEDGSTGMAFNLDKKSVGVVMLDDPDHLSAGDEVNLTGGVVSVPVGEAVIGRVLDARGRPLDKGPALSPAELRPVEQPAPGIMDRAPVTVPLQTGIKVIDTLIPIGRGQRELILGDRQTGKTAITLDTIVNQKDKNVICIYCGIGKRGAALAKVASELETHGAMDFSCIVAAREEDPPGMQFLAPYTATVMAEYFMHQGRDVLVIYDDLTRHARAYRELSLLLRRPPGREAYPGDIFYIHSRLLERATHLASDMGGGSLTALPIIETEAQNMSAYIPTNLISITDGQIYLSPLLFRRGILPAVDVGKSVSRVGGKAQLSAYRTVAGDLRLTYSQFKELESFSRFGARLDDETKRKLDRGRRIREILKQYRYSPLCVPDQIVVLIALTRGLLDDVDLSDMDEAQDRIQKAAHESSGSIMENIASGEKPDDTALASLVDTIRDAVAPLTKKAEQEKGEERDADTGPD